MAPTEAKSISTMAADLAAWERDLHDFEARFEALRDDEKVTAAKAIVPRELLRTRLLGVRLGTYQNLRSTIRAIGLDRALAARDEATKTAKPAAATKAQRDDPMDIGEVTRQHQDGEITTEEFPLGRRSRKGGPVAPEDSSEVRVGRSVDRERRERQTRQRRRKRQEQGFRKGPAQMSQLRRPRTPGAIVSVRERNRTVHGPRGGE